MSAAVHKDDLEDLDAQDQLLSSKEDKKTIFVETSASSFPRTDLFNELDYIISLGLQLRNCTNKFHKFEAQLQKKQENTYDETEISPPELSNTRPIQRKRKRPTPTNIFQHEYQTMKINKGEQHAEDNYIYRQLLDESTLTTIHKWPCSTPFTFQTLQDLDAQYEQEYGDDITLVEPFTQEPIMDLIMEDLVQQAWGRAVHLTDSVLYSQQHVDDARHDQMQRFSKDLFWHNNISCLPEKIIDTDGVTWFKCKLCTSPAFFSEMEWAGHFYPTRDSHNNGCAMRFLNKRRAGMIQKILQKEALTIIDGLLHILLVQIKKKIVQKMQDQDRISFLHVTWSDVIQIFEQAVNDFRGLHDNNIHETLLVHPNLPPIPLNNHILTVAKVRLIERYGKFDVDLKTLPRV